MANLTAAGVRKSVAGLCLILTLAGVGVAFKLCCELIRRSGKRVAVDSLLKITAIGTVADVAPLIGENRTIAWLGLNGLADPRNRGLRALIRRLGMLGRPLRAVDIGFRIGPRINAAGRLDSAETAIDLFAAADDDAAWRLCSQLEAMNTERQEIEAQVRVSAEKQIEVLRAESCVLGAWGEKLQHSELSTEHSLPRVLVLAGEHWHRGVIGLTAGRIAQKFHRPTLVISIDGDQAAGSARSIPTINLHDQLEGVSDLFAHFGGHDFACGFSLHPSNIPELRRRLDGQFNSLDDELFRRNATIDGELTLGEIDRAFLEAHEMLQPFGAGNPQPLFLARDVAIAARRMFGENCLELTLEDESGRATAVVWPSVQSLNGALSGNARADVLFHVEPDSYAAAGVRLSIADARNSAAA